MADEADKPDELQELLSKLDPNESFLLEPAPTPPAPQVITQLQTIAPVAEEPITPPAPVVDTKKIFDRLDLVTEEILTACRSDRSEVQDTIEMLRSEIDIARKASIPPARQYIEGLVQALEVKAGINQTAVKILEANAKMIAATKAGVQVAVSQINNNDEKSLKEILSEPMNETDKY